MLQNATPLRKSAPWPPNISDEQVSFTARGTQNTMHLCRSSCNVPRLPSFLKLLQNPHVLLIFDKVHNRSRLPRKTTSERAKVLRIRQFFYTFCALFEHLIFQKCSAVGAFCRFLLRNVLRATTACTFSTSSRQNGLQFFISHLARWLRPRRFSESTFRPSGATNHWKNTVSRDFPTFSRTCVFCLLPLSLLWSSFFFSALLWLFPPPLFHLSILSEAWTNIYIYMWVYMYTYIYVYVYVCIHLFICICINK